MSADHDSFVESVSSKTDLSNDIVRETLAELEIVLPGEPPTPRTLEIQEIWFSARKVNAKSSELTEFRWALGHGVFALASYDNLVGKSSVLRIILWALRGDPGKLQPDVRSSIVAVELKFLIGGVPHRVAFDCDDGKVQGALYRTDKAERPIGTFVQATFEATMGAAMLQAFGLDPLPSWQKHAKSDDGQRIAHGWLAYTGGFVVADAAHTALLGEIEMAGLPGRLLEMFVGVPWATTYLNARTKSYELDQAERNATRRDAEDGAVREEALKTLREDLAAHRAALAGLPDVRSSADKLRVAYEDLEHAERDASAAVRVEQAARAAFEDAQERRRADRAKLLDAEESAMAKRFFSSLDPKCCPRCDAAIGADRRARERSDEACAVCASPLDIDEDSSGTISTLNAALQASERAEEDAKAALARASGRSREALSRREAAERECREAPQRVAGSERQQLEILIARTEGAIEERTKTIEARSTPMDVTADRHRSVAKAAKGEAEVRVKGAAGEMFTEVDAEIVRLAHAFGMTSVRAVKLDRAGRLNVTKGDANTWFGRLTAGERLRMRVATIVAILRVAASRGVGRHPGLLLLDSAGAEEAKHGDAAELVRELARVSEEIPGLQVIVTTARPELLGGVLADNRVRVIGANQTVW